MASNSSIAPLYSPEEISKAWLERILSHKLKTQVSIQSWDMKIPEKRNGFLSEICFVEVLIYGSKDECKKIPLVVKFMSMEKERVEFIKLGNLGKREVSVYTHAASEDFKNFCFASGLDHPIPDVFCSCMGGDLLTIVLSDLNAKGYRMCAPAEGSTLQQIKSTFDSIAVIHAFGYASIYKNGREQFHIPFETSYLDDILDQGMRKLIKFFAGTTVEKTLHALVPFQKEMISVSQNYPLIETLVHGDLWAGNVMFTADDMKASIFDWQFACVDNPLCDVTSMLLISAEPAVYEEHLSEVLDCYWLSFTTALQKNGINVPITYANLLSNLEILWMHSFMFFTASFPDMIGNEKITESRIRNILSFLEKQGVFTKFLNVYQQ